MVKGWLDPVVAAKIQFTRSSNDLAKYIPKERLEICYGGEDPWTYEYIEPVPGENDAMKNIEDKSALQKARSEITAEFERQTLQWVTYHPTTDTAKELSAKRTALASDLFGNYWKLDKYVRTRTYYDRIGAVSSEGEVDFGAFVVT